MSQETPSRGRGACKAPPRDSCSGSAAPECPPCEARAPPACRAPARAALRGLRVACRPPPRTARPPCPARHPPCALTCEHLPAQNASETLSMNEFQCNTQSPYSTSGRCGDTLDRVAQRISAAKLARRLDYEREVAERKKAIAPPPPPADYLLGADRETVRATDGRDYIVLPPHPTATSDSTIQRRTNTASGTVELDPSTSCAINRVPHVDPCAHHPRILLTIDRSDANNSSSSQRLSSPPNSVSKPSRCTTSNNQFRSQDKSGLSKKNDNKVTVPKKQCNGNSPEKLKNWCSSPPQIAPEPPRCRQPSLVERLRRRPKSSCGGVRKLHSAISNLAKYDNNKIDKHVISKAELQSIISQIIADSEKLNKMLSERDKLKEAARGRIILKDQKEKPIQSGRLDLPVPAGTQALQVRVTLR
ncbi:unnamed protein product [Parnassius mnemosyne]|uniref:Uncharacterized protein n=1 Tax=Parnassius mnemosyne TaxID=213953 RepID=A0AAV1MAP4_9NEOP